MDTFFVEYTRHSLSEYNKIETVIELNIYFHSANRFTSLLPSYIGICSYWCALLRLNPLVCFSVCFNYQTKEQCSGAQ